MPGAEVWGRWHGGTHLAGVAPPYPVPSPAVPMAAGRAGTWRQGGWHRPGLAWPPFLLAPDVCQGLLGQAPGKRRPWQGFSSGLGSLAVPGVAVPHAGPWAGAGVSPEKWA